MMPICVYEPATSIFDARFDDGRPTAFTGRRDRRTVVPGLDVDIEDLEQTIGGCDRRLDPHVHGAEPTQWSVGGEGGNQERHELPGRQVAEVMQGETNQNLAMVRSGHAAVYRKYCPASYSDYYLAEEAGIEWHTAAALPVPEGLRALSAAAAEVC